MNIKSFIFYVSFLFIAVQISNAQTRYSKLVINTQMKDTFSFTKQWDYSWEVFKDDSTGEFTKNSSEPFVPADTAHLFYTANCSTNVQGGYEIRYCFADYNKGHIALTFSDGLPAYASEFYFYIKSDSFYFKPQTIYPMRMPGEKISYRVTKQNLTLKKGNYKAGDIIMGNVDAEFVETITMLNKAAHSRTFYLRGYIRAPLKEQVLSK